MNAFEIIDFFYPEETPLKSLLLKHSIQVKDKALSIIERAPELQDSIDMEIVENGALLHDIGIKECHAPSILCYGTNNYICHGTIGAELLRKLGDENNLNLEAYARICERHTGSGLSAKEIQEQGLPLPAKDLLPETIEEKLVCLADKFFSKSGTMEEKGFDSVRKSMMKFGADTIERFDAMCELFNI